MKKQLLFAALASAGLGVSVAHAQVCTPNQPALTGADSGATIPFDCATGTNQMNVACLNLSPIGTTNELIWQLTIGPGAHAGNITVTPTGAWDPYLFVMSGACNASSPCPIDQDNNGASQAESASVAGLSNGTYWLAITDESGSSACGAGSMTLPTLPVALKNFSIE